MNSCSARALIADSLPISVPKSSAALMQLDFSQRTHHHLEKNRLNTNVFANPARVADRVRTSRCFRRTQLMILNRVRVRISSVALLQLELITESRRQLSRKFAQYEQFCKPSSSSGPTSDL
eukprot:1412887-Pyramimonas_sp.AAC.1